VKKRGAELEDFEGYHSEWNLVSPGGWDYQRLTQIIGRAVWLRLSAIRSTGVQLDFNHPLFYPVNGLAKMLTEAHYAREGRNPGLIAVVAEKETLEDVIENRNLAKRLSEIDGITGVLIAPQELESKNGRICWQDKPISVIFMDFSTKVLLALHHKYGLSPLLQAIRERRVINPRGIEPLNVKSIFEAITGSWSDQFDPEIVRRTPWTRRFYARQTEGADGIEIHDLVEWARDNWKNLVLKPESGYSGQGIRVGAANDDPGQATEAIDLALDEGNYIVQEKIPLSLWAEEIPEVADKGISLRPYQTDFRCLIGQTGSLGFMARYGGIPTNVGSGGGMQPLAVLGSDMSVREAVNRINDAILNINLADILEVLDEQNKLTIGSHFTYILGPIKIALRPRVIKPVQIEALKAYGIRLWLDCLTLEKLWLAGELEDLIKMEQEEFEIANLQPWSGTPAIIASDGLFSFGADLTKNKH
jgi:hypothetical protein